MLNRQKCLRIGAIMFALVICFLSVNTAHAGQRFTAFLNQAQEVPPSGSAGTGYGYVFLSDDQTTITVNLGFTGLGTNASAAHIHTGAVGVNGLVTFGLAGVPAATSGVIPQQTFAINPAQVTDLLAGNMYFNVHSTGFPSGEIRAQILVASCGNSIPIHVEATAGTHGPTTYSTLFEAFQAINAGTHRGAINVEVCGNAFEFALSNASLNSGEILPANYTAVNVYPVGAARTIESGGGTWVIKLNGADNVTIDGRLGGVGTTRDLTIRNTGTATGTAAVWLSSVATGNGASNNVVRNLELATGINTASTASANNTFGILMSGTTVSTTSNGVDNDNNSFIANRIIKARYGIVTRGTTTNLNINPVVTDNIIGPAVFGINQIAKAGILMQADTGAIVSRNTVQFVGCLEAQACNGEDRVGIGIGSESWNANASTTLTSSNYTVTKNIIHDIAEENGFSTIGIQLATTQSGGATNNLVANNFIYNIRSNGSSGDQVCGIGIAGGNGDRVEFNSISITGEQAPVPNSLTWGAAIRIPGANAANNDNFSIRNNSIYLDASSSGTAGVRYYAIALNSAAYSFGTGGLNYNNYYINPLNPQLQTGGLGSTTALTLAAQFATLADWQAALATPQDANSIQADPQYVSNTADLHISSGSPNINAGLTLAGISDDIDGHTRPSGANSDIGADEVLVLSGILQLSSASYNNSEESTLAATVNRVSGSVGTVGVTYTLADGTGTGGAACTVGIDYINPGAQTLAFNNGDTIQPINVMLCTDLVAEPSETFTITLSLPTGGATLGTPTSATATITDVLPPFNGTYTVGSAGADYPSLTNSGGIFEAINSVGASGAITINIITDLAVETGTFALNPIAGNPTVLIKPSGAPRTVSGTAVGNALIHINGADNVRIDGSTAASVVGGTPGLRELTVQNLSTPFGAGVIHIGSDTESSNNNIVRNVFVSGFSPTQTVAGISTGGALPASVAVFPNNGNRVENCSIQRVIVGIVFFGVNSATLNTGTVISENDLSATGSNQVRRIGILITNDDGAQINQNSIGGMNFNETFDAIGIAAGIQNFTFNTTSTTDGGVTNAVITRNRINGITHDNTYSAAGIAIAGISGGTNTIANNMISGVISDGQNFDIPVGIFVVGVSGSTTRVFTIPLQ